MSLRSILNIHTTAEAQAVSESEATQKQKNEKSALPRRKSYDPSAGTTKQTASSIGAKLKTSSKQLEMTGSSDPAEGDQAGLRNEWQTRESKVATGGE